jgi:hypothetical protein
MTILCIFILISCKKTSSDEIAYQLNSEENSNYSVKTFNYNAMKAPFFF